MLDLKPGDIVRMNDQYQVLLKDRGKLWKVTSYPWKVSGTPVVKLEGRTSGYAVDGLDLVCEDVEALLKRYKANVEFYPDLREEEERTNACIRINNPERNADKVIPFLELVRQNPDLPIIPFVDNDAVCADYSTTVCAFGGAEVKTFVCYDERIYFEDDLNDLISKYYEGIGDYLDCSPDFSDDEILVLAHEWVKALPWKKAIIVWINGEG